MRGQFFGDLLMVLIIPLVCMLVAAFLAVLLAHGGNLQQFLPSSGY
ncbi:hypothetical protein ABT337_31345 [Saccharopolyspora hirsuta]|nr:hypothetical protein [Saccharopolyspora hirsuta]MBF6507846.1 hypothetical protein [Nocardia farcinica]